jgi:hypothetical protein
MHLHLLNVVFPNQRRRIAQYMHVGFDFLLHSKRITVVETLLEHVALPFARRKETS